MVEEADNFIVVRMRHFISNLRLIVKVTFIARNINETNKKGIPVVNKIGNFTVAHIIRITSYLRRIV